MKNQSASAANAMQLTSTQRWWVLLAALLSWIFAGVGMGITTLVMRNAVIDLLDLSSTIRANEATVQQWVAWYTCAFLVGAACGGLLFGWMGDRFGRVAGMGWSVICYSLGAGAGYFAEDLTQLLVLRFVACLGIGGVWPNAVALVSETWPNVSRPALAGILGTGANLGLVLLGLICVRIPVTPDHWRWVMIVAAAPTVLGAIVLIWVPESPSWLLRQQDGHNRATRPPSLEVFSRNYLRRTLIGIGLGTVPVLGNWGSVNWLMTWADQAGSFIGRPDAKAWTQIARSTGGALGGLLGGWAASICGRRWSYFLISLASLLISQYVFGWLHPQNAHFLFWTMALGFVSTIYFGWLPLFLPELFPVSVRSQGSGVSFNFGRYLSAVGVLATGLLKDQFAGDYARVGRITSLVFAVGLFIIWLAPETSRKSLAD